MVYLGPETLHGGAEAFLTVETQLSMTHEEVCSLMGPVEGSEEPGYLRQFGYEAASYELWPEASDERRAWPKMTIGQINGHVEEAGHTWYNLLCHMKIAGVATRHWQCQRRLCHLRSMLYEPVKAALGDKYKEYFKEARFASRGAPKGTTDKLQAWLSTWGDCINDRRISPRLVALTLRFLQSPALFDADGKVAENSEVKATHPVSIAGDNEEESGLDEAVGEREASRAESDKGEAEESGQDEAAGEREASQAEWYAGEVEEGPSLSHARLALEQSEEEAHVELEPVESRQDDDSEGSEPLASLWEAAEDDDEVFTMTT
eukprot:TRINITY_DN82515_c0_g1_i1.p1 TRINITY_DN82515_c0_g1~~TRINITY_DN82515_c0_g1_i1.p1  ORF type:complete len:353 (-),score=71.01 TRINITY_DN82515_c0_g1_i1:262-1218(-)